MDALELFILRIPAFNEKMAGQLIDYFSFYLQHVCNQPFLTAASIRKCFVALSMPPYSNISSYLSKNAQGSKGKYIKQSNGYVLNRATKELLSAEVAEIIELPVSTELIDVSLLQGTPYYIEFIAKEMVHCFDSGLYNATLVLMRKLIETLIIECFERHGVDGDIKDSNGTLLYLSDLIPQYLSCRKWNSSRNIVNSLKAVKKLGDLSAHNRRFLAKKSDIEVMRFDLRQAMQEIVLTIDYSGWDKAN